MEGDCLPKGSSQRKKIKLQEEDKAITASPTRLLTKYGLHCLNNELCFNYVRLLVPEEDY